MGWRVDAAHRAHIRQLLEKETTTGLDCDGRVPLLGGDTRLGVPLWPGPPVEIGRAHV